jgi:hypothetical protein
MVQIRGRWGWRFVSLLLIIIVLATACGEGSPPPEGTAIIFLHHSTGGVIWEGGVEGWIEAYNGEHDTDYAIVERAYPGEGYPWNNYPYDYWNIWVEHAGERRYKKQDTLEILAPDYELIIWKQCFPVSAMVADTGDADISSEVKSAENYKLQYGALKEKMHEFPETKFLVWTGAALVEGATDAESAQRAEAFFDWVIEEWDEPGDNIFVWDFWELETKGGLYLRDEYAVGPSDSHPTSDFAQEVAPMFAQRIVDVLEGRGDSGSLTGR